MTRDDARAFQDPYPDMMKDTRMLIMGYDVMRYHSFDLLRYALFRMSEMDRESFGRLRRSYYPLIDPTWTVAQQVLYMRARFMYSNVFDGFLWDNPYGTTEAYEDQIHRMFRDSRSIALPTDIATDLYVLTERKDTSIFLLRYTGDVVRPNYYDRCTVYESDHILDLGMAVDIIVKHEINAVMINSAALAVDLASRLHGSGYDRSMTFMVADYGYNYEFEGGVRRRPLFQREIGMLELAYRHEFGYFNPFTKLTTALSMVNPQENIKEDHTNAEPGTVPE